MKRFFCLAEIVLGTLLTAQRLHGDWPQYRYDAARSAASPEELPAKLQLQWLRHLAAPRPAFPAELRLGFDWSYEPVVFGKRLLVPSMVNDSVTAFDTETGAERWQFFAEGPVRFAPVAWQGNVYFVSDDGYLYCVGADDGMLRWQFRQIPPGKKERKIMGSGRLISLWPARGGPVLKNGVIYFAAGIWSKYGVAIYALDAESGRVIWANTESNQIPNAAMDHGIGQTAGLTPQGYLAIIGEKLVVPCGTQLPAVLDLKTGALSRYSTGWGGRNGLAKGTWFVAGAKTYLSNSGDLYDLTRPNDERFEKAKFEASWPNSPDYKNMLYPAGLTRVRVDPANQKDLGPFGQPVFASDVMYDNDQGIVAYDLSKMTLQRRSAGPISKDRRGDPYPDKWKADFPELWRLASPLKVYIKAGRQLYVGGAGIVGAVGIPQGKETPQLAWQAAFDGTPQCMLATDGKLFVVSREGTIYAYGGQPNDRPTIYDKPRVLSTPHDQWTKAAADVLQTAKISDGYALVLGIDSGRLAEEILRQSNLTVIAVDRDACKIDAIRRRLDRAGLYGTRASAHLGNPLSYPFSPYLASLIVSENWESLAAGGPHAMAQAILPPLRPYGGTACLPAAATDRVALDKEIAESHVAGATVRPAGDWLLVSRVGSLPNSADWSHEAADDANTGASDERFLKAPFELLWFDTPPRWTRTVGATIVRVSRGRMLILGKSLQAFDVYTGRQLWETSLPFTHSAKDQLVALADAIYVAGGKTCLVLNPATGTRTGELAFPAGCNGAWTNLRIHDDYLVGQSGNYLLCINRRSGGLLWKYECSRIELSVAVGGGKVFCGELLNRQRGKNESGNARARAFDLSTGKLLWEVAGGSELRYGASLDVVVMSSGIYRGKDGSLLAALPQGVPGGAQKQKTTPPQPLFVVGSKLLFGTAENLAMYDLQTGKREAGAITWMRRGCTVPRASTNFITTRFRGNAACIDLASHEIISLWNVRAACSNNLFPADGVLNMPCLTGGCTCNYLPVSEAFVPASAVKAPMGPD